MAVTPWSHWFPYDKRLNGEIKRINNNGHGEILIEDGEKIEFYSEENFTIKQKVSFTISKTSKGLKAEDIKKM